MPTTMPPPGYSEPHRGHRKTKSYPNISITTEAAKRESVGSGHAGTKRQREVSGKFGESAVRHAHHRVKSCFELVRTTINKAEDTRMISSAEATVVAAVAIHSKMTALGIQFDPSGLCGTHGDLARFNEATEIGIRRHLQIKAVTQLIRSWSAEGWSLNMHFGSDVGEWYLLCGDSCIDWIDYFKEQSHTATNRYKGNINRYCDCAGCWVTKTPWHVAPIFLLGEAVLNDTPPDVSGLVREVGILVNEAFAFHRREQPGSDREGESEGDSEGDSEADSEGDIEGQESD